MAKLFASEVAMEDRAQRCPNPRRLRLFHRIRRRALLPGCAADDRRRRQPTKSNANVIAGQLVARGRDLMRTAPAVSDAARTGFRGEDSRGRLPRRHTVCPTESELVAQARLVAADSATRLSRTWSSEGIGVPGAGPAGTYASQTGRR